MAGRRVGLAGRRHDLVGEGAQARAWRPRSCRASGSRRRPRFEGWRTAVLPRLRVRRSSARRAPVAGTPRRESRTAGASMRRRAPAGWLRSRARSRVTSSPSSPSPRVTARDSCPCLVGQRNAEAIDLELGDVGQRRVGLDPETSADPGVKLGELILGVGVVEAEHRRHVLRGVEPLRRPPADALGRRASDRRGRDAPIRAPRSSRMRASNSASAISGASST